jgi:CxxC motif-containing protein (DUF1111 family)
VKSGSSGLAGAVAAAAVLAFFGGCSASAPAEPDPASRLPGGATTNTLLTGVHSFDQAVENLSDEMASKFFSGNSLFNSAWVQAPSSTDARDGLGPLFNARNCSACHFQDGRGRPPLTDEEQAGESVHGILFRLSIGYGSHEAPKPDPVYGGQLQPFALPDLVAEGQVAISWSDEKFVYPDGEKVTLERPRYEVQNLGFGPLDERAVLSPRVAPQMAGLGLLEAIEDDRLEELADPDDANGDGISGRIRLVLDVESGEQRSGRFGWKAEQPSVRQQAAGAFQGDMGITSSLFPAQNCSGTETDCADMASGGDPEIDGLLSNVERYGQLLAVPARRDFESDEVREGWRLFTDVGCTGCHVASHETGQHELEELSGQTIWPYTDLLLHDMGADLADSDRAELDAEWRTPPLWGIGLIPDVNGHQRLLHDGRADGVEQAILWHGGEAETSRRAFTELDADARSALIRFINSL